MFIYLSTFSLSFHVLALFAYCVISLFVFCYLQHIYLCYSFPLFFSPFLLFPLPIGFISLAFPLLISLIYLFSSYLLVFPPSFFASFIISIFLLFLSIFYFFNLKSFSLSSLFIVIFMLFFCPSFALSDLLLSLFFQFLFLCRFSIYYMAFSFASVVFLLSNVFSFPFFLIDLINLLCYNLSSLSMFLI